MDWSLKQLLFRVGLMLAAGLVIVCLANKSDQVFIGEWGEATYGGVGGVEIRPDGTYDLFFKGMRGAKSVRPGRWVPAGNASSGRNQLKLIDRDHPNQLLFVEYDLAGRVLILRNDESRLKQTLYRMDD